MDIMTALATARLVIIVRATPPGLELLAIPVPRAVQDLAICDCKGPLHLSAACSLPSPALRLNSWLAT